MCCVDSRYSGDLKNDFTKTEKDIFCLTAYNHEYVSHIKCLEEKYSEEPECNKTLIGNILSAKGEKEKFQKVEALYEYYLKRIDELEDRNFEKFVNIDDLTKKLKLEYLYKTVFVKKSEGEGKEKKFKKVLVANLLNESWFNKDAKLRIDEIDEICAYHVSKVHPESHSIYSPTCYYISLPENGEMIVESLKRLSDSK